MRETIIGVFSVVTLAVTVLAFGLMRVTIGDVSNKGDAQRAVTAAVAELQVEGLLVERWLAGQANTEAVREPFKAGAEKARSEAATTLANTLEQATKQEATFAGVRPNLIVLFDDEGVTLGRNGSTLMRGEKLGARHPEMIETIKAGNSGSSVWYDPEHNTQLLASYAPIREDGEVIGGIAVGTAFNDERLEAKSTNPDVGLFAAVPKGEGLVVAAKTGPITDAMTEKADAAKTALDAGQVVALSGFMDGYDAAAKSLAAYGDGKQAVVVAVAEIKTVGSFRSLIGPFFGVLILGLILTAVAAHLIDNYISQPISDLEDGLLTVINGQTDIRFELEHKVLGGLVHRINSLLNQLLGVAEDDTDEQGRPSTAPSSSSFTAALNVDERMVSLSLEDVADAAALRDEAPEDYYKRIFDEYLAAKRSMGDPVDHIRFQQFQNRIKGLEQQLMTKHGKPFRYQVEAKGKEVVFVAVPLA
ncbi:MAG TPA: hypothetical protein ENK57_03975 [Polyangiaceae bacterium]|nr:hypothetical protein [Polyangiaceae bacterium]